MMAGFIAMTTWCAWLVHQYFDGPTRKLLSRERPRPIVPTISVFAAPFRRAILLLAIPATTLGAVVATIGRRLF
jgi:hypothetical protein